VVTYVLFGRGIGEYLKLNAKLVKAKRKKRWELAANQPCERTIKKKSFLLSTGSDRGENKRG